MNILIFGSSGFIGKEVTELLRQYHHVKMPSSQEVDFSRPHHWTNIEHKRIEVLCRSADVIVNMVGVMNNDTALSQNSKRLMENVHHHAPFAIAQVAKSQGVSTWINLSALGANPTHEVAFLGSKGRGDTALLTLNDESFRVKIARPSLVFGLGRNGKKGGASTELFLRLAKLPILVLPNGGNFDIQPVRVNNVVQGLVNLAVDNNTQNLPPIINFTGQKVMTLAQYLGLLRLQFYGKNPPLILNLPMPLAKLSARVLQHFSDMISVDSLTLLENGNVADNTGFIELLNRPQTFLENYTSH